MRGHGRKSIAVIGTGISGMAAAWLLARNHAVTVYERAQRVGGHSHTVLIRGAQGDLPVDTGFIVYNEAAYPNLAALFRLLDVPTLASDMSFSVSRDDGRLEYCGSGLAGLFAQRRNFLRPRFWGMLRDLVHFYRHAPAALVGLDETTTLGEFLNSHAYGAAFRDDHLLPMAGAIWSADPERLLDHPARALIEFFVNHQLLSLGARTSWRTVKGGSGAYVEKLTRSYLSEIRLGAEIASVKRDTDGVTVNDRRHGCRRFDALVIATHADQALGLLADPSPQERRLLGAFRYSHNHVVLHGDRRLMPRRAAAWSSWNHLSSSSGASCVTYWMNRLQRLGGNEQFFVTLNPLTPPARIFHAENYEHPIFDARAMAAQNALWSLQGHGNVWFCGAYFGAGFHEDGLQSALAVAEALGGEKRPWRVPAESGRIALAPTRETTRRYEHAA